MSSWLWDPNNPAQKVGGLSQYPCAGHSDPCPAGRGFIGDYFGLAVSDANVYSLSVTTHYPSGVMADGGGPVYYQQQVLVPPREPRSGSDRKSGWGPAQGRSPHPTIREVERKLATVLFVDLVDSTAEVARTDPEVVRLRINRFFDQVEHCVTSHGGIVEKFAGDAVMAAFGIPQAHEDDAERAMRASLAILCAVHDLDLEARIGVEAGEVVAETGDSTFATGEAVNLAARLQQAAEPGDILVGPAAVRLTAGRIEVEPVGPLELRGLETVEAWRVVGQVDEAEPPRSLSAPLVGRESELDLLELTFERASRDRRAHLFTVYGEAGIGKSRLAREFAAGLDGATVLAGRCLPYGEGITYWPLAEMVKTAVGIADDDPAEEAFEKLRESCEDEAVADLLALATGVLEAVGGERSQQEIAWAVREWAEQMAQTQPLVLVFEDIHWAEEPLLELIEHVAAWVRSAPLLLLCLARPELLDLRPGWGGGKLRATAIELEPLLSAESEELAAALLAEHELPADVVEAVLDKTEGNPLFVEETIRMLMQDNGGAPSSRIPDTLQALIAARIDRLQPDEKLLLQRAAVIGRTFWANSVAALLPDEVDVAGAPRRPAAPRLHRPRAALVDHGRRGVPVQARPDQGGRLCGPREVVARRPAPAFAAWLHGRVGEELTEIRGYHLDQACRMLAELDGAPPADLASETAAVLESAGRRALAREANASARKLLLRSVELEPTLERRYNAARAAWKLSELRGDLRRDGGDSRRRCAGREPPDRGVGADRSRGVDAAPQRGRRERDRARRHCPRRRSGGRRRGPLRRVRPSRQHRQVARRHGRVRALSQGRGGGRAGGGPSRPREQGGD